MVNTFLDAETFNQPLAWDTSEVTTHGRHVRPRAEDFNQPLVWDTSKVTSMYDSS